MLDKILHHYHPGIWVTEELLLLTSHLGLHCLHMRTLSWVLKYSLSRMLESAAEMINRHLRMLLYDNGVNLDLTALWRSLIRINAV